MQAVRRYQETTGRRVSFERDAKTGLYYHGYDESRQMYWADPVTGCSPNFWLRAMGWFLVAMVDVLERMDEQLYNEYRGIMAMLKATVEDLHKFQDEETGMFWQVIVNLKRMVNPL